MARHNDIKLAGRFIKLVYQERCIYCGMRATTHDHFAPVSVVSALTSIGTVTGKFLVPACGDCNSRAGNHIFNTIGAKRRFIQEKLARQYQKLLAIPNWTNGELNQVGYVLRQSIISALVQKTFIQERLRWRNSKNSEPVKLAKVRFIALSPNNFVQINVAKRRIELGKQKILSSYEKLQKCVLCDLIYLAKYKNQKYCSKSCYALNKPLKINKPHPRCDCGNLTRTKRHKMCLICFEKKYLMINYCECGIVTETKQSKLCQSCRHEKAKARVSLLRDFKTKRWLKGAS